MRILLLSLFTLLVVSSYAAYVYVTNKPPEAEISLAQNKLTEAKMADAETYAKVDFDSANANYNAALAEWKLQNEKIFIFRNFEKVQLLVNNSVSFSELSIKKSTHLIRNAKALAKDRIAKIGSRIDNFDQNYGHLPISKSHRKELAKSKLLYAESKQAFGNENYALCKSKLDKVEVAVNQIFPHYQNLISNYFKDFGLWKKNAENAISHSKKKRETVLIVDKIAHILYVYKSGKLIKQFDIEMGLNWIGDKMQQGDKSTPEGNYRVIKKKSNGNTKYYKALLLDYPNQEDKKRFALNKKKGLVRSNSHIGNYIEIHGHGGKGFDWTDGCVALKDSDMDELFGMCSVQTMVTIVGSTRSFNQLNGKN